METTVTNRTTNQLLRVMIYLFVGLLTLWLVAGYLAPLIMAAVVASIFLKIKEHLPKSWLRYKNTIAAISTLLTLLVIILPTLFILTLLGVEAFNFVQFVQELLNSAGFNNLIAWLNGAEQYINILIADMGVSFSLETLRSSFIEQLQTFGVLVSNNALAIIANFAGILVNIFFFLFILFFLVRDGETMISVVKSLMPFSAKDSQAMVDSVEHVGQTVILGSIAASLVMGAIMMVVFWLFGFHSPVLWGLCIAFLSLIPLVGTWLVYVPSAIFLYFTAPWYVALIFLVCVFGLDSFLFYAVIRPKFLDERTHLYPLAIFLAIIGGLSSFGPIGIVYGPLIMSLFIALMKHVLLTSNRTADQQMGQSI
ncbi:hypothetical protein COW46_03530 [Candidatus Gracilibacteria bacterium CG17_big_fil_post_rev_8_21_14_2_50_48_13]|nr:MAG: hypothetical protein COW46_03530 [Candidatus Gracilibacteria bacterium CG17_big_fil_post_rev_8_21_14_2_50_48_13]